MALVPNHFTETSFEIPIDTDDDTETLGNMSIESGYYRQAGAQQSSGRSSQEDSVLLESTKTMMNQFNTVIRQDREEWSYDVFKGPPTEYKREVRSSCYLPKLGRSLRTVEEETVVYWTFTPLADGDNLGKTRFVSAYVVYDLPVDPEKTSDEETKEKKTEAGFVPADTDDKIVSSGKLWSEGVSEARIAEDEQANQVTKWVKNVIIEHDIVEEEPDKWTIWTITKNALRPQDVKISGPRHIKKTGFVYRFPYPLEAPKLKASSTNDGVRLTMTGGGVTLENKWFHETIKIPPEKYNIYRAKISEPDRDESGDRGGFYDDDPAAVPKPKVIGTSGTTDQGGAPADPVPPSAGHPEPGDPSPPEEPKEVAFTMIGTVDNDNARRWRDEGHAQFLDADVQNGGEYEYYVVSIIGDQESPESNHVTIVYNGPDVRDHRLGFRTNDDGSLEIDAEAPDDPGVPPPDYGEVIEVEVPTTETEDDLEDIAEDIVPRQFAATEPDISIAVDVLIPLLGLEYGQAVFLPEVLWETYGNQLVMSQQTLPEKWQLSGFRMSFERGDSGSWTTQRTNLSLRRRTVTS